MGLNAKNAAGSASKFEPMEAGTYPARLVQLIDYGLQPQRPYQGQEKDPAYEIGVTYEFLDEFMKDEDGQDDETKPRWLTEFFVLYNLEADKAKSTKRYLSLDPEQMFEGDWTKLLGTPCMVTVVQNPGKGKNAGRVYENIAAISAMRAKDAAKASELVNEVVSFDLDEPNLEVFMKLQKWQQEKIKANLEYAASPLAGMLKDTESAPAASEASGEDENPY